MTFENVQAGERTSHLFRLANHHGGLVIGTGDLSELALGWCTYGVGDQMSHYSVNASVPKTLIKYLIRWVDPRAGSSTRRPRACSSPSSRPTISPELIPRERWTRRRGARERTIVGPFALQDFFLYYISRFGYRPSRVAFLAEHAWGDRTRRPVAGRAARNPNAASTIAQRSSTGSPCSCAASSKPASSSVLRLPNAPKVGSGGSLSPRSDWRAPSDGHADAWLNELEREVPDA